MLRPAVKELADKLELTTSEDRPDEAFWINFDTDRFLSKSIAKHSNVDDPPSELDKKDK